MSNNLNRWAVCPKCGSYSVFMVQQPYGIMEYKYHLHCPKCGFNGAKRLDKDEAAQWPERTRSDEQ